MSESITDKRTLGEIADDDKGMFDDVIKNAKKYNFGQDVAKAKAFIGACLDKSLKRCGLTASPHMKPKMVDMLMKRCKIKIESRSKYKDPKDAWKNGIYVYKGDQLAAFISQIFVYRPHYLKIDQQRYIAVITNVKV